MANKKSDGNGISKQLQTYVREIKGTRTVREFARDTGISTATLSKYMTGNGKGDVKIETLKRIVAEEAKPQGEVSFYDLMRAAGLDIRDEFQRGILLDRFEQVDYIDGNDLLFEAAHSSADSEQSMRIAYYKEKMRLEAMIKAKIFDCVICSNGALTVDTSVDRKEKRERNNDNHDLFIRVNNGTRVWRWYLDFKLQVYKRPDIELVYNEIGRMALKNSYGYVKRSIIVNNKDVFDRVVKEIEPGNNALQADVSIIYCNEKTGSLEEEAYLSVYDEDSPMFSIISI